MLTPGSSSKFGWRGSLGSIKQPLHRTSDEPDLLSGIRGERAKSCGKEVAEKRERRKGIRKRFLSLTEGLAGIFSPEKRSRESLSRKGSQESLRNGRQSSVTKFPPEETTEPFSILPPDSERDSAFRRHGGSFSSFRPTYDATPDTKRQRGGNSGFPKGRSPALDRLKKAPPSPPPRRCSSWLTPDARARITGGDPLAKAVLSSSLSHLPLHLRPPPPPPPVRYCHMPSCSPGPRPSYRHLSRTGPKSSPAPYFRERSLPSDRVSRCSSRQQPASQKSYPSSCSSSVVEKTVSIVLQKENGTFGFTLRGGMAPDGILRPLLVTHVRPGGPADREGSLKAGDRLIALDGKDMSKLSLAQAQVALQEVENSATLAIRFDISVMDSVRCSGNPLLVEIERSPGSTLGLNLNSSRSTYSIYNTSLPKSSTSSYPIVIESIRSASIAERCGALAVGDTVCAVDGLRLDQVTLKEANQILSGGQGHKVTLEVIPGRSCPRGRGENPVLVSPSCTNRFSYYNTFGPSRTLSATSNRNHRKLRDDSALSPDVASVMSHRESVRVTLVAEGRSVGMVLRPSMDGTFPVVAVIDPGGATDKLGVICIGDRILGVNGRSVNGLSVSEVTQMLNNTRPTVIIDYEIDVTDSVIPSSGTFSIKLSKRQCCLGINIARGKVSSCSEPSEEAILISDIKKGSAAHRSGTLQVGDRILAIDNTRVDSLSLDQTRELLRDNETDLVTLKVQKDDLYSEESKNITYTVQIHREKGVLGISAAGTEEPFDPIIVGGIVPGSLAAQTGAIHVGDRLLSINGVSLRGKPLSEAIRLLQSNEDSVTIKISRFRAAGLTTNGVTPEWMGFHGAPALSVDSAVESWGSGGIDPPLNGPPTLLTTKTDSTPELFRSNCGSTVRRKLPTKSSSSDRGSNRNEERKSWGCSSPSSDSGQSEDGTDWEKMIADLNQISATCGLREKSILHDANGNVMTSSNSNTDLPSAHSASSSCHIGKTSLGSDSSLPQTNSSFKASRRTASPEDQFDEGKYSVTYAAALHNASSQSTDDPCPETAPQIFTLTLAKDRFYEDFGFSVSDGLYEKGVYVNRIRKGGPAHRSALLRPYDRILQVNETQTEDFDCCLTVPLIASAEDSLFLKVSRTNEDPPASSFRLFNDLQMNAWLQNEDEEESNGTS